MARKKSEKPEKSLQKKQSNVLNQVISQRVSKKLKPRLEMVLDEVSQGVSKRDIVKKLCEEYNIKESHAENLYIASFRWLQSTSKEERQFLREKHEAMLMNLYRINIERGDFKEAHSVLQTLNKMFGIEKKEQERVAAQNTFEFKFNIAPSHVEMVSVEPIDVELNEEKDDDE